MVLSCLMSVFNTIGGRCLGWISTEAAHLISYGDNVENLRKHVQDLSDAIKSINDRIKEAENSRGATLVDAIVNRLLERMASLKEEASKIIIDEERSSDCVCLIRLRLNLWATYLTSKLAKKAINEALELLEKEKNLNRPVSNIDYSNCLAVNPNSDFEELESRVLASNQIVKALKDPNVHKVGVYGMGGTGKTTLAVKIGADLYMNGTFNYVVMAIVSEKQSLLQNNYQFDLTSIQKQIAGGLKIQLEGETLNARATQLRDQLQKRDKLLIILDDIWSKFELEMVGIPVGCSFTSKFKILITSRSKMVLENEMNSTNNFRLDSLPINDARNLFDKMVGNDVHYSNWPLVAHQIVDLCGGIPILLVTTGRALRNANQSIWEDALTQLKQFNGDDFDEEAYKKIEVSYNFLKNQELQKLLLLCAQLDHRFIGFEDLLRYSIGLDLFKGRKKIKEVSARLHKYLHDLKGCCLLQDGNEEGVIKMHDVVHKFACSMAFRDHNMFSVANHGELEEWPSQVEFENFSAISLPHCHLPPNHFLPATFDNSKLESFLMFRSEIDPSFKIPDNFFAGMKGLKLMDLTKMSLSSVLVSSLNALVKLRTLCLDYCELSDISVIGELPMLQALSFVGSSIMFVPKEMGKLGSTLKLLDLRRCWRLKKIASGVIFKLILLEDLRIGANYKNWERLESNHKRSDIVETKEEEMASMEEFKNLRNLINLEIHVGDHAKMFPKDLVFTKLEKFTIFVGSGCWYSTKSLLPKALAVDESSTVVEFDSLGSKALMTNAGSLRLTGVTSSVSVSEMDPKGFPELKYLTVDYGHGIRYIVMKNYNRCIFPKLETLDLSHLHKLERICDDHPLPVGSFENLRVIQIHNCELLNHLLSSNLARGILRLKEMRVEKCESMENIIVSRERETEHEEEIKLGFTHQLQALKLYQLHRLISFYNFKQIEGTPSPTHLFNKKIMFPKLKVLVLDDMKIEKIWEVDHLAERICWFQNLISLEVSKCDNLSYLFTSSMVKSLVKLKQLEVRYCKSIEEIVATTEEEMDRDRLLLFPKLESLELRGLPKLNRFCHANLLECQSLQTLKIRQCPMLNAFMGENESSLLDEKIVFQKLQVLELREMKIKKIWDVDHIAEETTCCFQNLTSLRVSECGNLIYLFTSSMVKSFAELKQLRVDSCASIEEIVVSTAGDVQLWFPKLDNIKLEYLPKLKRFCEANLFECQSLRKLVIQNCPELKKFMAANDSSSSDNNSTTLFTEKVVFPNIEKLKIHSCNNLRYLFSSSMIKSHAQLKQLGVGYSDSIEEIVVASTEKAMVGEVQLSFSKLDNIDLMHLPNLKAFCQDNLLECQLFPKMGIEYCSKLRKFVSANDSSSSDNSTTLFIEQVAFPNMEEL